MDYVEFAFGEEYLYADGSLFSLPKEGLHE